MRKDKKYVPVCLLAALLCISSFTGMTGSAAVRGDVNLDHVVDIMDVIRLNKFILGIVELNDEELAAADIIPNQKIDAQDSLYLLKLILQINQAAPIPDTPSNPVEATDPTEQSIKDESGAFAYTFHDGILTITGLNMNAEQLVFPDTIQGMPVKQITGLQISNCPNLQSITLPKHLTSVPVISNCPSLTSVNIPESITHISARAFTYCSGLREISFPRHLQSIGDCAFWGCTGLTELVIPESVKELHQVFQDCTGLTNVTLPEGMEVLDQSFNNCKSLTEISIPATVTQMNDSFNGCTSLTSIYIPADVTVLTGALKDCSSLASISVDPDNRFYHSVDGVLFSKDGQKLMLYPQAKPDIVYTIPDMVTTIISGAFQNVQNLNFVTLSPQICQIGDAFTCCRSLKQITIPDGVESLEGTFYNCHALESVTLPKSLSKIGDSTFYCNNLKEIRFLGSMQDWSRITVGRKNQSLYQAKVYYAEDDDADHQQYTLYKAPDVLPVPEEHQSYQIKTESKDAAFAVIAGNAAEVSNTGLVKPTKNYGETIIRITDSEKESFLHVTTEDYAPVYADARITAFLDENITADMTDLEKLEVIGKLPASMDYNSDHWDYIEMFAYNTGNCAGSATMLVEMCRRLGIRAWVRNAKRDPDAGSAHVNALAEVDGAYYELEAGFQGKAPRSYKITKRTSLCKYKDAADGIDVYQYDGIDESDTVLTIPDSIDGKTVTRIGDGFLTENPWVRAVTIPDAVTEIDESAFPSYQGVLFGAKGSATEHFAAAHGIRFGVTSSLEPEDVNF